MTEKKSLTKLQGVKGMNDILPQDAPLWHFFEETAARILKQFNFQNIRTPILEQTAVFVRGIGEVTDIVEKEMYTFIDQLNQESLTLRPEGTAACIRAVNEHHLLYEGAKKLWYMGPMFRHERPQRGRYRQFHQLGVEAVGFKNADADAELIALIDLLFTRLGIRQKMRLEVNCLGDLSHRQAHRQALVEYFNQSKDLLDEDSQRRLKTNPLRILDSKNPAMQDLIEQAPKLSDYIEGEAAAHFQNFLNTLDDLGIIYQQNHRLVRGLDYYNRTVFEWITDDLGAQGTVCGGGRYDPLIAMMGGKDAPAVGFAIGIERTLELIKQVRQASDPVPDIYIVHAPEGQKMATQLAHAIRSHSQLHVILHLHAQDVQSFKAQFKKASQLQARFALMIGEEEASEKKISIKDLTTGDQKNMPLDIDLNEFMKNQHPLSEDLKKLIDLCS
jgi:histidyl-tRNA synthetase